MENATSENGKDVTNETREAIKKTYAYHKPSETGIAKIKTLRAAFSHVAEVVERTCPNCRERIVALTNLEQAAMWAIKSTVCNDPESTIEN